MWKNEKFSLTEKIFRQINSLVTYLVKPLFSRNFWQKCVRENSRNFHTVHGDSSIFQQKFRETNAIANKSCNLISRNFAKKVGHKAIWVSEPQCGNYGNSLSRIFGKNFVKVTILLNKLLKSWFDEIFFRWERISRFSTLWGVHSGKRRKCLGFVTKIPWNRLYYKLI